MIVADLGIGGHAVAIALGLWFVLTIPHQFTNKYGDWIKRINLMALIPSWTFFAPTPGMTDYRFVFRDRHQNGFTAWHEIEWCNSRRLVDAVWHPRRHRTKLIVDCVTAFIRTVQEMKKLGINVEDQPQSWALSVPYMALLNIAVSMPRISAGASARQFAIIEVSPSAPGIGPRLIVCSSTHDL